MRISDWSSDVCRLFQRPRTGDISIIWAVWMSGVRAFLSRKAERLRRLASQRQFRFFRAACPPRGSARRSEEHTSELQSLMRSSYAVFCLKETITILEQAVNIEQIKMTQ